MEEKPRLVLHPSLIYDLIIAVSLLVAHRSYLGCHPSVPIVERQRNRLGEIYIGKDMQAFAY
jgi:hypothetical protein